MALQNHLLNFILAIISFHPKRSYDAWRDLLLLLEHSSQCIFSIMLSALVVIKVRFYIFMYRAVPNVRDTYRDEVFAE